MKNIIKFIVKDNESNQRVDLFLSNNKKELSRTRVKNLILNQRLMINEKICTDPSKKVGENDNIKLEIPEPQKTSLEPFDFKLNVIYEDKDLMVIDKPAGISMHPGAGDYNKTLVALGTNLRTRTTRATITTSAPLWTRSTPSRRSSARKRSSDPEEVDTNRPEDR